MSFGRRGKFRPAVKVTCPRKFPSAVAPVEPQVEVNITIENQKKKEATR
jgi:hypothetical protein